MEFSSKQWIISFLCGLVLAVAVTKGAENEDNDVEMKLYQVSVDDWNSSGRDKYKTIVAEEATSYCADNKEQCNNQQPTFVTDYYDEKSAVREKAYLVVKYSMKYSSSEYLSKSTLKAITINSAEKFGDSTDMTIVDVDGESQPLPPDNTLNIAICVTAIVVLIILIVALLIMQHKCGGHDHELLAQKEDGVTSAGPVGEDAKKATRVGTLQSVVTDDQLPGKKEPSPPPGDGSAVQTSTVNI